MVKIVFIDPAGVRQERTARAGDSLMETAVNSGVEGIEAACGGSCICGTCHVFVDESWLARLGPRTAAETGMLEAAENTRPASRLSCQIRAGDEIDGIVVHVAPPVA